MRAVFAETALIVAADINQPTTCQYPFGESHTLAGANCLIDWMHEQDVIPVRASYLSLAKFTFDRIRLIFNEISLVKSRPEL